MQANPQDQHNTQSPQTDDFGQLYGNTIPPLQPTNPIPVQNQYTPNPQDGNLYQQTYTQQNNIQTPHTPPVQNQPQDLYEKYEHINADYPLYSSDRAPVQNSQEGDGGEEAFQLRENTAYEQEVDPVQNEEGQARSNRLFYIITGVISGLLLIAIAILSFMIYNASRTDTMNNASQSASLTSSNTPSSVDTSSSASSQVTAFINPNGLTPAAASLINEDTTLSTEWLSIHFPDSIDTADGSCSNEAVCGINADPDNDNLPNIKEYNYQTNPQLNDTDSDGIADGDELFVYLTSPKEKDSDGDKIDDITEILGCTNPALRTLTPLILSESQQKELAQRVTSSRLSEKTISTLINAKASQSDIQAGTVVSKCQVSNVVLTK